MKFLNIYLKVFVVFMVLETFSCTSLVDSITHSTEIFTASSSTLAQHVQEDPAVQKWKEAEKGIKKLSNMMVKSILPHAIRASETLNLTTSCSRGLIKFLTGLKQMKLWAFRMLDASGKIPDGILGGSLNSLGDYDICIDTDVPGHFQGQYCLVEVSPPVPPRKRFVSYFEMIPEFINVTHPEAVTSEFLRKAMYFHHLNFRTSICVPSTCSKEEIQKIAAKVMEFAGIEFDISVPNCEMKVDKFTFSTSEICIIAVLSSLLLVAVIATVTDVVALKLKPGGETYQEELGTPVKCLLCFSFYTNIRRLLKKDESQDSIKIFHGIKVITLLWVMLNHTYYYINYQALSSLLIAREATKEVAFQLVLNGFLNVETFFFISAVLVSYGVMKMKERKINVFLYVFRRLWRLTPPFMFLIACIYLIPYLGSGPVWKETVVDGLTEKCKNYWWANLVYINNFLPNAEMCMNWSWYIPVDTHLYFISLIVLIPLKRNPRLGFMINGGFLVVGTLMTAVSHVYYKLHPTAIAAYIHPDDIAYFVERGYFRTYVHCASYCVGLTVGYILATRQKFHIPLSVNIAGWLAAFTLALSVLYGVYEWNLGNVPSLPVSTLYNCTNKLVWALALAWVTIACVTGNGGIATTILSWQAFVPLARLTYMAYLAHPLVQFLYFGSTRTLIRPDHRSFMFLYLANIVLGYMCAFCMSLLFESPFMALEKVLFATRKSNSSSTKDTNKDTIREYPEKNYSSYIKGNGIYTINIKPIDSNN